LIIEVVDASGVKRKLEYDSRRRLTRVKNAANVVLVRYVYGDKDQVLEQYDAFENKTSYDYTIHLGEPLLTKVTTPQGRVSEFTYDAMGRLVKSKTPSGSEWNATYVGDWSVIEKITDPLAAETSFQYDARLNRIKITDPLSRITQTVFDDLDLPREVTDALGEKTQFENNGNRDMKKLTDARDNAYTMVWEESGVRKSLQWPDAAQQTGVFDANGALVQWTARGGAGVVNLTRDAAGEVSGRTWTAGTESGGVSFTRNAQGQLTVTTSLLMGLSVNQALTYDAEGRLSGLSQTIGNVTRAAAVTYDLAGRLATLTYPAGFVISYDYTADGQIAAIKKDGSPLATYGYDSAGRLATRTLSNGVGTTYTYDAANRLASLTVSSGGGVLWAERYGYNAAGERIYTLHGDSGTAGDGYWLDATSQLRGVNYGAANATLPYTSQSSSNNAQWQYDEVGNRIVETGTGAPTNYFVDEVNQYTAVSGVAAVGYSARGDLTQYGDWSYTYDAQGNMIRAHNGQSNALAQYWRDAFGHRAVKDVNGSKTIFFNMGTSQLEAYNVTNATASSTIHEPGIDRPFAEIGSNGSVAFFYHQDWLGNVVLLTGASANTVESYSYSVWGQPTAKDAGGQTVTTTPKSRFLFTAREYDPETALYHYRARAYSPQIGRFLQTDPIDFGGGDVNLFRYVSNNPVNWVDPLGLQLGGPSPYHQLDPGPGGTAPKPGTRMSGDDCTYTPAFMAAPGFRLGVGILGWGMSFSSMASGAAATAAGQPYGPPLMAWGFASHGMAVNNIVQGATGNGFVPNPVAN